MIPVSIDYEKCNVCSVCVQGARMCFSKKGKKIEVEANEDTCMLCGRCVSLCPSGAITHHVMNMDNFPEAGKKPAVKTDDFIQFIRERRSHRAFTKKKIPRKDLEKLIDTVRYAPTGHNEQNVEIMLVQNPERRKKLSDFVVDHGNIVAAGDARKLDDLKASGKGTPEDIRQLEEMVGFRSMLSQARDAGFDPIFYEAPAVAIFHSTTRTVTPKDNCVIASTTMGLLARTMGLETTYIALFENAANAYQPIKDDLKLPEGHRVLSVLVIGYPKFKFLRAVDRKPIKTRWE